jgi:2-oxo-4-hydroxy-4-carboxy--5-ureidoimidazoline (OHCU) decarboxylase
MTANCFHEQFEALLPRIEEAAKFAFRALNPDYSHPFIQLPFVLRFAHRRITGVFGAHTAPFPVDDFSLLGRTRSLAPRV